MQYNKGQKLVCVNRDHWANKAHNVFGGTKFNEIVTVEGCNIYDERFLAFYEYQQVTNGLRHCFDEKYFEPLISDEELEEQLEDVKKPFEV
jgi:hypothetical protein